MIELQPYSNLESDSPVPVALFTELLILQDTKWRETARWIKFEESVEQGGNRWSKPFVPTVLLSAFNKLRNCLSSGCIILNANVETFSQVTDVMCWELMNKGHLRVTEKQEIIRLLSLPHTHQHEHRRNASVWSTDQGNINFAFETEQQVDRPFKAFKKLRNKLAANAEACTIFSAKVDFLTSEISCFVRLSPATILGDLTEISVPSRFIFFTAGPNCTKEVARSLAIMMSDEMFSSAAHSCANTTELLLAFDSFMSRVSVLPASWDVDCRIAPSVERKQKQDKTFEEIEDTENDTDLRRSGKPFGGLISDIKRRKLWYLTDFRDALSPQCLASCCFMYFGLLAPIVTFGGLLDDATEGHMGAMENIFSGSMCGVVYHLLSGQPLTILGSTGPVLVFESILYDMCKKWQWHYLSFRFWVNMWLCVILLLTVALDGSVLVKYITRFTEESFAVLIALIYIYQAIEKLIFTYGTGQNVMHWIAETNNTHTCEAALNNSQLLKSANCCANHDVFLMSLVLLFGTFALAMSFKMLPRTRFMPYSVRKAISDFGVFFSILLMVLIDYFSQIDTPKLTVPSSFQPTIQRSWIVHPLNENPPWTIAAAILPALLASILVFMDQQITAVIVNRKENKLNKGAGYHLDLFVLSFLIGIVGVFGLPIYVAATVLSINHVNSLKVRSEAKAPGENTTIVGVREQRMTGILTFLLIGASVFLTDILKYIPMPVLYGVFLYMGVSALEGIQLMDRLQLYFMPVKHQPDYIYLRHVPLARVHIFSSIQLLCLIILWIIKLTRQISIAFPLMLVVMVCVRKALERIFSAEELRYLDDRMPEIMMRKREDKDKPKKKAKITTAHQNLLTASL